MGIANTVIEVRNGNIGKALKEYKEKTLSYGIKERLTEKKEFIKPSEIKRIGKQKAIYKNKLRKNGNSKSNSL